MRPRRAGTAPAAWRRPGGGHAVARAGRRDRAAGPGHPGPAARRRRGRAGRGRRPGRRAARPAVPGRAGAGLTHPAVGDGEPGRGGGRGRGDRLGQDQRPALAAGGPAARDRRRAKGHECFLVTGAGMNGQECMYRVCGVPRRPPAFASIGGGRAEAQYGAVAARGDPHHRHAGRRHRARAAPERSVRAALRGLRDPAAAGDQPGRRVLGPWRDQLHRAVHQRDRQRVHVLAGSRASGACRGRASGSARATSTGRPGRRACTWDRGATASPGGRPLLRHPGPFVRQPGRAPVGRRERSHGWAIGTAAATVSRVRVTLSGGRRSRAGS